MTTITERVQAGMVRVQEVLADAGQSVILRTTSAVLVNANAPWLGTQNVPVELVLKAAVSEYSIADADRGTLQEGDLQCLLLALDLGTAVPTTNDHVIWQGVTYGIDKAMPIHSGNDAVAYELRLRA